MSKKALSPNPQNTENGHQAGSKKAGSKKAGSKKAGSQKAGSKMGDLPLRIISAIILATAIIGFLWLGGLAFGLIMSLMAVLIHFEWNRMVKREVSLMGRLVAWGFLAISLGAMLGGEWLISLLVLAMGFVLLWVLSLFEKRPPWTPVGLVYAAMGALSFGILRADNEWGVLLILYVFILVWATDSAAYGAGRIIGGPKFAPTVSPKKTWAGFFGGVSIGTLCACLFFNAAIAPIGFLGIALTLALAIASQYGDLFESWIKRRFGVKDSSQIIPGHGGVMDRVDGLIVGATLLALIATITVQLTFKDFGGASGQIHDVTRAAIKLLSF